MGPRRASATGAALTLTPSLKVLFLRSHGLGRRYYQFLALHQMRAASPPTFHHLIRSQQFVLHPADAPTSLSMQPILRVGGKGVLHQDHAQHSFNHTSTPYPMRLSALARHWVSARAAPCCALGLGAPFSPLKLSRHLQWRMRHQRVVKRHAGNDDSPVRSALSCLSPCTPLVSISQDVPETLMLGTGSRVIRTSRDGSTSKGNPAIRRAAHVSTRLRTTLSASCPWTLNCPPNTAT